MFTVTLCRNTCQDLSSSERESSDRQKDTNEKVEINGTENFHKINFLGELMKNDSKYSL